MAVAAKRIPAHLVALSWCSSLLVLALSCRVQAEVQTGPGLQEWTAFLTKVEQDCMNKTGINKSVIDRTKATLELPDEPIYKEYISCFYKKQGYQNEDGDILFYNIKNMISDLANSTIAVDVVNACQLVRKVPSHEDYAYQVAKCLLETSKQKLPTEETLE